MPNRSHPVQPKRRLSPSAFSAQSAATGSDINLPGSRPQCASRAWKTASAINEPRARRGSLQFIEQSPGVGLVQATWPGVRTWRLRRCHPAGERRAISRCHEPPEPPGNSCWRLRKDAPDLGLHGPFLRVCAGTARGESCRADRDATFAAASSTQRHFLGCSDAACRLIQLGSKHARRVGCKRPSRRLPGQSAACSICPRTASARSVREVYEWRSKKHGDAPGFVCSPPARRADYLRPDQNPPTAMQP
jgi:hypothetical protein